MWMFNYSEYDTGINWRPSAKQLKFFAILIFALKIFAIGSVPVQALFGPKIYFRSEGKPLTITDNFKRCESDAEYKLIVNNGKLNQSALDHAFTIRLNGKMIAGPLDLNGKVVGIEKSIEIQKENSIEITLNGKPGSSIAVTIACVAKCLDLSIDTPSNQAISKFNRIPVIGKYVSSSNEISILVNGTVAGAQGGRFGLSGFKLISGDNMIEAEIKNACLESVLATSRVSYFKSDNLPPLFLSATPSKGLAPLVSSLRVQNPGGVNYVTVQWDLNGDGIVDTSGQFLFEVTHTFSSSGLYQPRVFLKDASGLITESSLILNVVSMDQLSSLLQDKWSILFGSIQSHDTATALQFMDPEVRENYRTIFLNSGSYPILSALAGELKFKELYGSYVTFTKKASINGIERDFFVKFKMDESGFWKIHFF
jgi:hypothetical protein